MNGQQIGEVSVAVKADLNDLGPGFNRAKVEAEKFDRAANNAAKKGGKALENMAGSATKEFNSFGRSVSGVTDKLSGLPGPLGSIAARAGGAAAQISTFGFALAGAAVAVAAFAVGMKAAVDEAEQGEREFLKTAAIVKATGSAAGLTTEQILELTNGLAVNTLATEGALVSAAGKLLTFRSVSGDTFREALKLSTDLAAVGFGSVESAATQLGKALEDPVRGVTALRRAGVTFNAVQKKQIKDFVETNQLAKAQALILATVAKQVGGTGEAEASGLSGAYHRLSQNVDDFLENLGKSSGALAATTAFIDAMARSVNNLNKAFFETDQDAIQKLVARKQELMADSGGTNIGTRFGLGTSRDKANAEIKVIDSQIMALQNKRIEEQKAEKAAKDGMAAAKAQADADFKLQKQMEASEAASKAAADAAKQLAEQRKNTVHDLTEEVRILGVLNDQYSKNTGSLQQMTTDGEIMRTLSALRLEANSAEGKSIADLITKRDELNASIEKQTKVRADAEKAAQSFEAQKKNVSDEITDIDIKIHQFGMLKKEAEAYRIEQELTNKAIAAFGSVTEAQAADIKTIAESYGDASAKLDEYQLKQKEAEEEAQRMADSQQRLQESLAEGLTDAIFNAGNAGDAFNALALQIAKAVVQAELLALIQAGTGMPTGAKASGGGGSAIVGALGSIGSAVAGFFGGGGGATAISSVMASRMHSGGIGGIDGHRMNAPASMFIGAPRFHGGLRHDEFPAILQDGEEVIPKDQVGKGGGRNNRTTNNNFYIQTPDPNAFRASQRQISRSIAARV